MIKSIILIVKHWIASKRLFRLTKQWCEFGGDYWREVYFYYLCEKRAINRIKRLWKFNLTTF